MITIVKDRNGIKQNNCVLRVVTWLLTNRITPKTLGHSHQTPTASRTRWAENWTWRVPEYNRDQVCGVLITSKKQLF